MSEVETPEVEMSDEEAEDLRHIIQSDDATERLAQRRGRAINQTFNRSYKNAGSQGGAAA